MRGMLGHNDLHANAPLLKAANDLARLVNGNPASHTQKNGFNSSVFVCADTVIGRLLNVAHNVRPFNDKTDITTLLGQ